MHAARRRLFGVRLVLISTISLVAVALPHPASAIPTTHWVAASGTVGANSSCAAPGYIGFTGLSDAVAAAVDSDTVKVCPGTYTFTESITVTQKNITITGSGASASDAILDGNNSKRLFTILSKKGVTISNLTLQNANSGSAVGGAIYIDGGNAAYFDGNTHHVISGNNFYKNHAGGTYGGAITVHGYDGPNSYSFAGTNSVEISNNLFLENSAAFDGGAIGGGAIGSSSLTAGVIILNNRFAYNRAINRSGGAIAVSHSSFTVIGNAFFQHQAGWVGKSLAGEIKSSGNTVINSGTFTESVPDCSIPTASRVLTLDGTLDSVAEQDWANNAYCGVFPIADRTGVMPVFIETTTAVALTRVGSFVPESPKASSTTGINNGIRIALDTSRSNGGETLTTYEYSFDKTNFTSFGAGSGALTTLDITGLTNESSYTVYLRANNTNGASLLSSAITVTAGVPATAPGAPTMGTPTQASATTANIAFTPPTSTGGRPITSYTLYTSVLGTFSTFTNTGQTSVTATGLSIGRTYRFLLRATNAIGSSSWSSWSINLTIETPTVAPVNAGPPNLIKFTSVPRLEIVGNRVTCSSGVADFWRASITREDAKLDRVLYTLIAGGKEVSTLASSTTDPHAKPSSASPGTASLTSATWTLDSADMNYPMACEEVAFQENASGSTRSVTHENPVTLAARAATAEATHRSEAAAAIALVELNRVLQDFLSTPIATKPAIVTCRKPGSTKRIRVQGTRCPAGYSR